MDTNKRHENYPFWIVMLSNLVSLGIVALGFLIFLKIHLFAALVYILYFLFLEYRLIRHHCIDCFYFGHTCAFGQGHISALFFRKGNAANFCNHTMTWKDMILDILISLLPVLAGIILLVIEFDYFILAAIIVILFLTTFGNSFIRGKLACRYCKQRDLGCPAEALFNKTKNESDGTKQ